MNFLQKKENVRKQLGTIYSKLENDLLRCGDVDTIKTLLENEVKRVTMYADAVESELLFETKDDLRKKTGKAIIDEEMSNILQSVGHLKVTPLSVDYSKAYRTVEKQPQIQFKDLRESEKGINAGVLLFVGLGAALGGGIGFVIASKGLLGASVGVVTGAVVGGGIASVTKTDRIQPSVAQKSVRRTETQNSLDIDYFEHLVTDRNMDMNSLFLTYIGKWERSYQNFMGL